MKGVVMCGLIFIFLHAILAEEGFQDDHTEKGSVEFWGTTVTLICPAKYRAGIREKGHKNITKKDGILTIEKYTQGNDGGYDCMDDNSNAYQFYIKGKVCANCYELNWRLVLGVIVGDLMLTCGIMMIVYLFAQKKAGKNNPSQSVPAQPKSRAVGRGPPEPPATDYQPLNIVNRDIYTSVNRNG